MTAPRLQQPLYRLPPRPALLDWLWAGAGAGLVLGLAELTVALPAGSALDPRLAALVLGVNSAVVSVGSFLVGAILHSRSVRVSRSGLVGAVLGPLLFASISGQFWSELVAGGPPEMIEFAGLMTAALLATAAGLAASRLADALERRGMICSAPYVWGVVALSIAASERLAHAAWFSGYFGILIALAVVLSAAAATWAASEITQRRESRTVHTFGWLMGWLGVASMATAAAPVLLPWLLFDRAALERSVGPPNVLVAVLPDSMASERSQPSRQQTGTPTLGRLEAEGSSYEIRSRTREPRAGTLLTDTRGAAVVPQLFGAGYAAAAILPGGEIPAEFAGAEVDARPGARRLLEDPLAWLGAAPLLTGPALPLLHLLGLDTDSRDVNQIAERARIWLLDWSMERSAVPFILIVDFRDAAPPPRDESLLERSDARLDDILEHLRMLEIEDSTIVVVLSEIVSQQEPLARITQAVVRPPTSWPRSARSSRVGSISDGQLGDFLLEASRSDSTSPVDLPRNFTAP